MDFQLHGMAEKEAVVPVEAENPSIDTHHSQPIEEGARELMELEPAAQKQQNPGPVSTLMHQPQQQPQPPFQQSAYDPRALLNPQSTSASTQAKRPAEQEDRGREADLSNGQISLVERLHNVHERTASPAKRPRIDESGQVDLTKKPLPKSSVGNGGGVLDLKPKQESSKSSAPTKGPAIDLTMSKFLFVQCRHFDPNRRRR